LRQKLGVGLAAQADAGSPQTGPGNPATASLYFGGLDKLRHFDALGARDLLQQAVAAEPGNALAHNALSQAWAALGYSETARLEAQKAWQLSGKLPRPDRLSIEAGYRAASGEWDRAIRIYRQLAGLFPDDPDYALRLSRAQIKVGQAREALATLERLRRLPSPVSDDAAILLAQSEAAGQLGDFEKARSLASASASAAQARGAQILVAQGRDRECRNLIQLSRAQEAAAACESAKQIYGQAGDRAGLASTTGYLASTRFMLGDLPGARTLYSQALAIDRELGNEGAAQWEHNGLATVLWQEGDLSAARGQYEESLRSARLIDSRPDQADALENIGFMWMLAGDLSQARTMLDEALSRFQAMADKAGAGSVWNNLGQTRYLAGDLPGAADALSKAIAIDRDIGYQQDTADALMRTGRVYLAQANWSEARRVFGESARVAQQSGSQVLAEQSRVAAAELSLATGSAPEAEKSLHESLAVFERENRRGQLLQARTLLAEAFLAQGKAAEARQEVDRAAVSARATQQLDARLEFAIVAARVRAASAKDSDRIAAVLQLQAAAAEAARHGVAIYGLQARLALAQILTKPADLAKLESEARALGFEAIARQAAAARAKSATHA
jgi:tetratricopeptide (TPR) repeat protein